ncbi:unnamed protein product [Malus baccata var. baccata]
MPVTQSTCTSNFPPNRNSAVLLPPYSLSCSTLSSAASTFFTRSKNTIFKPNSAPFRRAKPQRGARLIASAAATDYYKTLNYHPHKGGGAEDKFKEISAAYEQYQTSSLYDRFGEAGLQGKYDSSTMGSSGVDPFDVFDTFFGGSDGIFGGRGESGGMNFNFSRRGNQRLDIRCVLYLSFEESISGVQQEIEVSCVETCDDCGGTGAKSDKGIKSCTGCGGRGGVMKTQKTPFGTISQVKRPAYNIKNHRNCITSTGDVYIVLHVDEKGGIRRDGLNLYSKINIDYTEAILGTIIQGIQPGETVKLRRMGVPDINRPSARGDHCCALAQRALVEELASLKSSREGHSAAPKGTGIRDGNFGKHRTSASNQATKRSASLWESIRGVLGKRQSGEGFASLSVDRPPLSRGSFKPNPSYMASVFTVLVVTCICTVIGKADNLTLLQQKDGSPRTRRTKKNNVDRNTKS